MNLASAFSFSCSQTVSSHRMRTRFKASFSMLTRVEIHTGFN